MLPGGFSQTQVDMGVLRMQQAGVIPVGYSNVAVELLADNAAPEAEAVYAALGMPFSTLVFGLRQGERQGHDSCAIQKSTYERVQSRPARQIPGAYSEIMPIVVSHVSIN